METKHKHSSLLICLLLAVATISVYLPVTRFDFVNYDDPEYVSENPRVQQGVTFDSIIWAFTTTHAGNWHPLTWLSHMLDWKVFGASAGGHHLVNVLIHIVNTALLFFTLRLMTGVSGRSAFVAALFALHPLHVESVAWISERKDVLSALFWMLTMFCYVRYARARTGLPGSLPARTHLNYVAAVICFAIGLFSKQMLVTLPFALLLLDIWPLERFDLSNARGGWKLIVEKIPFFVGSAVFVPIVLWAQKSANAVVSVSHVPLDQRIENAIVSYFRYFAKTVWPADLAVFYPYADSWPVWLFIVAAAFLIVAFTLSIWQLKGRPWVFVGWCWFVGTMVPVIGLVQVGSQSMADRYTYLPSIGLFIVFAWLLYQGLGRGPSPRRWFPLAACIVLALCVSLTAKQVRYWRDSITLFSHALETSPQNTVARVNLGNALVERGQTNLAVDQFSAVLATDPRDVMAHANLAQINVARGNLDEAARHYEAALQIDERNAGLHNAVGMMLAGQGRFDEAVGHYQRAIELDPDYVQAIYNLGNTFSKQSRINEAIATYQKALAINRNDAAIHNNLGTLLLSAGRRVEAEEHLNKAIRLRPDYAEAHQNLALLYLNHTSADDSNAVNNAALQLQEVLRLNPNNPEAHFQLGVIAVGQGDFPRAILHYRAALRLRPQWPDALNNLAWLLATSPQAELRDGEEAVRLAAQACELDGFRRPMFLGTLAAAHAEAGRFAKAIELGEAAYQVATSNGQTELAEKNLELLKLYRAGHPYWQPPLKKRAE